jgi:hypothetical protein
MAEPTKPSTPADAGLTDAELAAEEGSELPDREAMSMLHILPMDDIGNLAMPINQAFSINLNTNQSIASATADQVVVIDQGDPTAEA